MSVPTDATVNTVSNEAAEASPKKSWRERDDAPDPSYDKEYRRELEGWCTAVGEWIEQLGIRNLDGDVGTAAQQLSTYMDMHADTHPRGSLRRDWDWGRPIDFPSEKGMRALSDHLDKRQVDTLGREWTEKRVQKTHNAIRELNLHAGRPDYYEDREKSAGTRTDMPSAD